MSISRLKLTNLDYIIAISIFAGGLIADGSGTIAAWCSHFTDGFEGSLRNAIASTIGVASFFVNYAIFWTRKKYNAFSVSVAIVFAFFLFPYYLWYIPQGIFVNYLFIIPITFGLIHDGEHKTTIVCSIISAIVFSAILYFKIKLGLFSYVGRANKTMEYTVLVGFNATYIFATIITHFINGHLRRFLREYETLSFTDELTQLPNRRRFDADIDNAEVICGVMVDIDHFKLINDVYGHKVGDEALRKLADIAKSICSEEFKIYRYGGEEFYIISKLSVHKTIGLTKILVDNVRCKFSIGNSFVTISCGIGLTVAEADQQVYKAKENGRNQIWYNNQMVQL